MTTPTTATKSTTTETVARVLAEHPTGITVRDLAEAAGVGASTASKALTAMEAAGTATRTPGPANGNRKSADVWHPATDAPATADEATTDTTDTAPADPAAEPTDTDDAPTDDAPTAPAADTADTEAPVAPRKPDLKLMLVAGVLGDHPDGVSANDAITESGLAVGVADTILAAMEVAGAAVRRTADDGTETWVLGEADLATVDPANAPTHVTCQACGHTRRIRRASAAAPRRTGTGRPAPEANSDGSDRLMKNGLRNRVEAFMRDLGPGHRVTPGTVARELGRSSGAVGNAMHRLANDGVLMMVNEAPVMFEVDPDAPAPAAPVATQMTLAVVTAPAATDDTATDASDHATADSTPTGDAATTGDREATGTAATDEAPTAPAAAPGSDAPAAPIAA